jgi:aminoglycoside/choline kinase family phosphotransferase
MSPAAAARTLFGTETALTALTPEVSPRRYFRPADPAAGDWLLVLSPAPAPEATTAFLDGLGIRVPAIGATIDGAYLVEDLGDRHLAHAPDATDYELLLDDWRRLAQAQLPPESPNLALALDRELFDVELGLFHGRYLCAFRGMEADSEEARQCTRELADLADAASSGPQCLQHRDFHSRNILLPPSGPPAWIDHQDLRRGPLFYDLASLYTDAYVEPPDEVYALLREAIAPLGAAFGLAAEAGEEYFLLTALQRVLKALGTFGNVIVAGRDDYRAAAVAARRHALALLDQLALYPALRGRLA